MSNIFYFLRHSHIGFMACLLKLVVVAILMGALDSGEHHGAKYAKFALPAW